ncbi:hypothetical protein BDZ91DRAFT_695923 [Kalaharituber pfeilii]|nr:hypothetical protein BDZ91DRAFT_695923 [Kalaharituber pfeilii]
MAILDLESQLAFYRSYHHNPTNVLVHLIFIPVLVFTTLLLATSTGDFIKLPYIPINGGALMAGTYLFLYFLMEPVAGLSMIPPVALILVYLNKLHEEYGAQAILVAGVVNISSWIAQFIGHGVFEKRAPALKDNFIQALFLAPFFVWFELLFSCGYRPELHQRVEEKAVAAIAKYRATEKKRKAK